MFKKTLITLTLPLLSVLAISAGNYTVRSASRTDGQIRGGEAGQKTSDAPTGTFQFAVGANSFLPILVFNDLLRSAEPGSMTLIQQDAGAAGISHPGYGLPA